jgi:hypothetical protein
VPSIRTALAFFFVWLPGLVAAQTTLTGTVRDSLTHEPLAFASVFLANTTRGATTDAQGRYALVGVPAGHYDLTATYLGYQLKQRPVIVTTGGRSFDLNLLPATQQLAEVVVRPRPPHPGDYERFVELFLGRSTFSRQCRIRNPKDVLLDYDPQANELTASAYKFVQVDNQALGYRIKYYGLRFQVNFKEQIVSFYGQPVFEEMTPRNARQQQHWVANRRLAYLGSLTHFLRSVYENRVAAEGFLPRKLRIVPNPHFARADSLRRQLLRARRHAALSRLETDSLAHWAKVPNSLVMLYLAPRPIDSLRRVSADGSRTFLRFTDQLQVSYLRRGPDPLYRPAAPLGAPAPTLPTGRQISQLLLTRGEAELLPNGQLANPLAVFTDEYWGFEKMGEFLPLDYQLPTASTSPTP